MGPCSKQKIKRLPQLMGQEGALCLGQGRAAHWGALQYRLVRLGKAVRATAAVPLSAERQPVL